MNTRPVPFERLIAFAAGRLPRAEAEMVESYLAADPEAARIVARFRAVAACNGAEWFDVPHSTLAAAKALFAERPATKPASSLSWLEPLKRVVAALIYDSRPQLALAGFRGASTGYQLAYETDEVAVDVEVESQADGTRPSTIRGQVSANGETKIDGVVLCEPGSFEPRTMATVDKHGLFTLTSVKGNFDLLIAVNGVLVVIPNFEVQ